MSEARGDRFALPPFGEDSPGDCILRSHDGVHYKVYKVILGLASPVFKDMFEIPQGNNSDVSTLPLIYLTEPSHILHPLLKLFYPVAGPVIDSHILAFDIITACEKYMVNVMILRPHLTCLMTEEMLKQHGIEVYSLAWRLRMKEEAQMASRYLHGLSKNLFDKANVSYLLSKTQDMEAFTALCDLQYRREYALDEVLNNANLAAYRCDIHQAFTVHDITVIRMIMRTSLSVPFPICREIPDFFGLKNTSCSRCAARRNKGNQDKVVLERAIAAFPQVINWPYSE